MGRRLSDFDNDSCLTWSWSRPHLSALKNTPYAQRRILYESGESQFKDVFERSRRECHAEKSSRGLAIGDYDNDGDTDIFISNNERAAEHSPQRWRQWATILSLS